MPIPLSSQKPKTFDESVEYRKRQKEKMRTSERRPIPGKSPKQAYVDRRNAQRNTESTQKDNDLKKRDIDSVRNQIKKDLYARGGSRYLMAKK